MFPKHLSNNRNRSSFWFISGVCLIAGLASATDHWGQFMASASLSRLPESTTPAQHPGRGLTAADRQDALIAWRYFEQNYRATSGFVDSVAGFPSGTLWDQGSYLFALLSARGIDLIDTATFESRVSALLRGLEALPLVEGKLPNKVYHSVTLEMVDYKNRPTPDGVGWSALDICRMLAALRALELRHPQHSVQIRKILSGWSLGAMAVDGQLYGATRENGEILHQQEGRIGYEQYGARAAALWGLDSLFASSALPIMEWTEVQGIDIPVDRRTASAFGAITPTLSEPFFLQGLEMGFNSETALLAHRVYLAQEARFEQTGTYTMVSEGNISVDPYFVYASVHSNDRDWAVMSKDGTHLPDLRTISLKAVFAWDALYETPYTRTLRQVLSGLATDGGWIAGQFETDDQRNEVLTANTNAVILQALHYKHAGPLLSFHIGK